jgi:hypothetical protein
MKSLIKSISFLLILVIGSSSILNGFSEPKGEGQHFSSTNTLQDATVHGDLNYFIEVSTENILIPSIKVTALGDWELSPFPKHISYFLLRESINTDWFKKKERFFNIQILLFPFHHFL